MQPSRSNKRQKTAALLSELLKLMQKSWQGTSQDTQDALNNASIIAQLHILPTLVDLLVTLNVRVDLIGKFYSMNQAAVDAIQTLETVQLHKTTIPKQAGANIADQARDIKAMGTHVSQRIKQGDHLPSYILLLTDGGSAIEFARILSQYNITREIQVGIVEQTTSGMVRIQTARSKESELRLTTINVAGSAYKRSIESAIIAKNMLTKLTALFKKLGLNGKTIGIIGASGAIGKSFVYRIKALLNSDQYPNVNIVAYNLIQQDLKGIQWIDKLPELFQRSDIVISATGGDISSHLTPDELSTFLERTRPIHLINMASRDEFEALLQRIQDRLRTEKRTRQIDPLADICYRNITILSGGMPANLVDAAGSMEGAMQYDHPDDFTPTRALILGATYQLILLLRHNCDQKIYQLSPSIQYFILHHMKTLTLKRHPGLKETWSDYYHIEKLAEGSDGDPVPENIEKEISLLFSTKKEKIAENPELLHFSRSMI